MKAGLVVSLVLLADLQALILLEPGTWVAMTIIAMAAVAFLVVRISRRLIRSHAQRPFETSIHERNLMNTHETFTNEYAGDRMMSLHRLAKLQRPAALVPTFNGVGYALSVLKSIGHVVTHGHTSWENAAVCKGGVVCLC